MKNFIINDDAVYAVSKEQVQFSQDFVYSFVCNVNTRLAHKADIFTLESCSVFDPRVQAKKRNSAMRVKYLEHLWKLFAREKDLRLVLTGAVSWFSLDSNFDTKDSICSHLDSLQKAARWWNLFASLLWTF